MDSSSGLTSKTPMIRTHTEFSQNAESVDRFEFRGLWPEIQAIERPLFCQKMMILGVARLLISRAGDLQTQICQTILKIWYSD